MKNNTLIAFLFMLILTACGYGREDDKRAERQEDLQELSQEMNGTLTTLSSLKIQLRDSISDLSGQEDSLAQVKVDKYRLLLAELEQAEQAYKSWIEQVEMESQEMNHDEVMQYYDEKEETAKVVRQDMRKAIEYVESELREQNI